MKLRQQKVQNISDHKFGETAEVCKENKRESTHPGTSSTRTALAGP